MIDAKAVVDASVKVPESCRIGPFCRVGPGVEMGADCELISHVVLEGPTKIGRGNRIFPFAAVGCAPQDLKYKGEPTRLEMGDNNQVREYVTIHRGTVGGGGLTRVGSSCLIMAYSHIAHDCVIGDGVIMANASTLAGHVIVEDYAAVGAFCPVHQFVTIGRYAYIGGGTVITRDVLPFSKTSAAREAKAYGVNSVGLERRGFSPERVRQLQHAFRVLLGKKLNTTQALERLKAEGELSEDVKLLVEFIEKSQRGVIR